MEVLYNVEEAKFENNILLINGWIIDGKKKKSVDKLQLIIKSVSGLERCVVLESFEERKDVSECFGLNEDKVGFRFRNIVKFFYSARIYLEYELSGRIEQIKILEISGDEKYKKNERLIINHLETDGFCSVENLQEIKITNYKWKEAADKEVDVIIPVYNGYDYFDKLFDSIFSTDLRIRVIVIDDCSPDKRIQEYLDMLSDTRKNVVVVKNEMNLGFVKSVNIGLALSRNDVVLLNTDIEVPENWLERLMYPIFTDKKVATTTPYTNCGTLCSFPEIGKDNVIFDNRGVYFVDSVFKDLHPIYTEIPTGVGFCMGMSHNAIAEVGMLDEESFGKGYGEENDWCQRAIEKGYKNVQVENLFVYHKHGGSFQSEEKKKLQETNMKRLEAKYPNYLRNVAKFFEDDSNMRYRSYALFLCLMQTIAPSNIFFNHVLGGGANDYMTAQIERLIDANEKCITFEYNVYSGCYRAVVTYKSYNVKLQADTMDKILSLLRLDKINNIYINELVTYPDVDKVLERIIEFKKKSGAAMIMLGHDYYSICPTINLLNKDGKYCCLNCDRTESCLKENKYIADLKYIDIERWHTIWKNFIIACDSLIVFSNDSKDKYEKIYGKLDNLKVVPHKTDRMLKVEKKCKMTDTFNVAILGVLSDRKGLNIVKNILKHIEDKGLPITIVVIGVCEEDISGEHCIVTGRYTREQLPSLMYLYDIDMVFISSVWPETFSYTAEEAMKMCMPVAVFDLGAPAERVHKYEKGIIINNLDAESAVNAICEYANSYNMPKAIRKSFLFIIEYKSFSSRYRVEHFREHLAYIGIYSKTLDIKEIDLDKISEYDVISIYRCSDIDIVKKISDIARKNGQKLLYDIDDFIFDFDKIAHLEFLEGEEYKDFATYSKKICACMELCDILTTSTTTLAEEIRNRFPMKQVIECRNSACMEMQLLSEMSVDNNDKHNSDRVVLGYFSGSHTHDNDWKMIENVVYNVIKINSHVELMLVGALQIGPRLSECKERVMQVPFVDWQKLPKLLRSIDINLMPLENSLFHWCKSENKWMEAGLVGIPTVASRNPELERVMTDRKDVLFCNSESDWEKNLIEMVNDIQLRYMIGNNAKARVYEKYLVTSISNYSELVNTLIAS